MGFNSGFKGLILHKHDDDDDNDIYSDMIYILIGSKTTKSLSWL